VGVYAVNILAQKIVGRITNYRTGIRAQYPKECLVQIENVTSASLAGKLVGQKVTWKNGASKFTGKIMGAHGRNGMVRVRFTKGVPGQAIGNIVELVG
jgi:large subunit ribosomal protein L35Ae